MNPIGFYTLLKREIGRFFAIIHLTLTPSVISSVLYFIIFGYSIGRHLPNIDGITYLQFIVPGLIMGQVITSAYMNTVYSIYMSRRFGNIKDILTAPLSYSDMVLAFTLGGVIRAIIIALAIFIAARFFVAFPIQHIFWLIFYLFAVSFAFSSLGMIVGLWAEEFENLEIFPTFILTPLIFLGGVFYSITTLPPGLAKLSLYNPIFYMVDGFRYSVYGIHDSNLTVSFIITLLLFIFLFGLNVFLFRRGWHLRT